MPNHWQSWDPAKRSCSYHQQKPVPTFLVLLQHRKHPQSYFTEAQGKQYQQTQQHIWPMHPYITPVRQHSNPRAIPGALASKGPEPHTNTPAQQYPWVQQNSSVQQYPWVKQYPLMQQYPSTYSSHVEHKLSNYPKPHSPTTAQTLTKTPYPYSTKDTFPPGMPQWPQPIKLFQPNWHLPCMPPQQSQT